GQLSELACVPLGISYQSVTAAELPEGAGGKDALLKFHRFLKDAGKLISDLKGKKTAVVFFLDKDIDDLLRTIENSPHIIYTAQYDVEGHIFEKGDFVKSAAALAGLNESEVRAAIGDPSLWRELCAKRWMEW